MSSKSKLQAITRDYKRFIRFIEKEIIGKDEEALSKDDSSINWINARNNLRYEQRLKLKKGVK